MRCLNKCVRNDPWMAAGNNEVVIEKGSLPTIPAIFAYQVQRPKAKTHHEVFIGGNVTWVGMSHCTMVQNKTKTQKNHPSNHCPTSKGVSEVSERANTRAHWSKRVSSASEQASGRASDPVLQSGFLIILALSALSCHKRLFPRLLP